MADDVAIAVVTFGGQCVNYAFETVERVAFTIGEDFEGFFVVVELLIIGAGIYVFRKRENLFAYKGKEGDTSASANLRLAMVVLIWVHAIIFGAVMIFEV